MPPLRRICTEVFGCAVPYRVGVLQLVMLSLALVVAFGGMARAAYGSIVDWMNTALNPDLFVSPTESFTVRTFQFPSSMGPELAAMNSFPGVGVTVAVLD